MGASRGIRFHYITGIYRSPFGGQQTKPRNDINRVYCCSPSHFCTQIHPLEMSITVHGSTAKYHSLYEPTECHIVYMIRSDNQRVQHRIIRPLTNDSAMMCAVSCAVSRVRVCVWRILRHFDRQSEYRRREVCRLPRTVHLEPISLRA